MIEQYKPIYSNGEGEALKKLVESGSYLSDFKKTEEFEEALCKITDNKYCHAVNNGTVALMLALMSVGIKQTVYNRHVHKVIVPNFTMVATATAVQAVGAEPYFCDIEPDTLCLDVDKAIEISKKEDISAIIYVSLNGRMNLEGIKKLKEFCSNYGIPLIKDDAQALGSYTQGIIPVSSGKFADITTLSFSPHKIISCGQGGAILTNDENLSNQIARLKDFGRIKGGADVHEYFGINSKFTEMQAVVGLCQLNNLTPRILFKRWLYSKYQEFLGDLMLKQGSETPWFIDIYLSSQRLRNGLIGHLNANNIGSRPVYPMLIDQEIYKFDYCTQEFKDFTVSNSICDTGLWLPSSFDLKERDIKKICETIQGYLF